MIISDYYFSKVSGLDYIPVVILENSGLELLYILAELLNMCLKESYLPDFKEVAFLVFVVGSVQMRPVVTKVPRCKFCLLIKN